MRKIILFILLTPLLFAWSCKPYAKYYRKYTNQIFGITYPYQLFLAQGAVESHCSLRAISNDGVGSQGIGQITWRWWKDYLQRRGVPDLKTIDNQVKAQIQIMLYNYRDYVYKNRKVVRLCGKQHWIPYQVYNGGKLVYKEILKANTCKHNIVRKYCKRKIIHFSNGSKRDSCDINYKYPEHILYFAKRYYNYYEDIHTDWRMFK